ncbi:inositol monophosphatase [Micromonospora sp. NPDC048842]|uniref:inositol monophosphatase family protein n=1 Tax=Micromonospora sp. NPDC048842 TaxID=3154346 RepID=UPI0033CE595B
MNQLDAELGRRVAIDAVNLAGEFIHEHMFDRLSIRDKGDGGDVVTTLDTSAERIIIDEIRRTFPDHAIVAEESGSLSGDGEFTWLVDPLDGTNNLAIGLPVLAVGVALCRRRTPILSAVHDPVSKRTWSAIKDRGAWDNDGKTIRAPERSSTRGPVLAWLQGYDVRRDGDPQAILDALIRHGHRLLDLWAPLPCWLMLAKGDIDGIVGYDVGDLDLHAGRLIATEAGAVVRNLHGEAHSTQVSGKQKHRVVAALPGEIDKLTEVVSESIRSL